MITLRVLSLTRTQATLREHDKECPSESDEDEDEDDSYKLAKKSYDYIATVSTTTRETSDSEDMFEIVFKGPLPMTTLAIVGPGSFFDTTRKVYSLLQEEQLEGPLCIANPPLTQSLSTLETVSFGDDICLCRWNLIGDDGSDDPSQGGLISTWLYQFTSTTSIFSTGFTAVAYLSNAQVLNSLPATWAVYRDLGEDMHIPKIYLVEVIVVSILLAIYLIPQQLLSIYTGTRRRWTDQLDASVTLQIGASAGEDVFPMRIGQNDIAPLDRMSGAVRDVANTEGEAIPIGRVGFGEGNALSGYMRYERFEDMIEALNWRELRKLQESCSDAPI